MTTSTVVTKEQSVEINNPMLEMFINTLTDDENHSDEGFDTTTRNLGYAIIEGLGGETEFLALHKKIAKRGLDDVDCSFTRGSAVPFYFANEVLIHWACAAVSSINEEDFLLKKVFDRISDLEPNELASVFNERPNSKGQVSKKRGALIALLVDICVEDFCRNFIAFSESMDIGFTANIQ